MNIKGPFTRINYNVINLNSDAQIKNYLLSQGWQPTQWNYKKDGKRWVYDERGNKVQTSPKLTEDSFDSVDGDIPKLVARRSVLLHRRGTISNLKDPENKGWLSNIREDGRIEACAVPQACNTGRFRHSVVVNVPKASPKVPYGEAMRSLFIASPGYTMIGVDAKALEARTEAHNCFPFTGGQEYAHTLVDGDVHAFNAAIFGTDRDGAKAPKYCLTYGGYPPKLAQTCGCTLERAQELFDLFWTGNTALAEFKDSVIDEFRKNGGKHGGFIRGLDGRKLYGRSEHSLVNLKFQSDGAILVKAAMCFLFAKWLPKSGIDYRLLIQQHDEWQCEVREGQEEEYIKLALASLEKAGQYFNYNVPILGDAKCGNDWSQTH